MSLPYFSIAFIQNTIRRKTVPIFISPLIPWELVLNAPPSLSEELSKLMFWILIIFSVQFLFRLINSVLLGVQKPEAASLVNTLGQVIGFLCVYILFKCRLLCFVCKNIVYVFVCVI